MDLGQAQQTQVRWMGMIAGVFVILLGAFLVLTGALMCAALVVGTLLPGKSEPPPAALGFAVGTNVLLGIPIFLYGRSVFRRARTDAQVVATITLGAQPGNRTLAWVGAVFSSLLVLGALGGGLSALAKGQPVPGGIAGAGWFLLVLAACIRYLRKRPEQPPAGTSPPR